MSVRKTSLEATTMPSGSHFSNLRYARMNARRLEHLATLGLPLEFKTVLEIGAGVGDLTTFFLDRSCSVTSIEPRHENVAAFLQRYQDNEFWPQDKLRIIQNDVSNFIKNPDIQPCQIVFSYGLLYHLGNPMEALQSMSAYCTDLFLLETVVDYSLRGDDITFGTEDSADFTNSIEGAACAPSRLWLFNRLRELFDFVYAPLTQPAHDQFRLDWRKAETPPGRSRAVFVASCKPISNPLLLEYLPDIQFLSLPSPLSISISDSTETLVQPSCFGPLRVYADDLITDQIREFGAHTRNEVALLKTFISTGDLVYDIGAHIGTFTIPLSDAVGTSGRVIAIEGDPRNFELLTANLSARGLVRDGSPILAVVSNTPERYSVRPVPGNSGATYFAVDSNGTVQNTVRLDDLHRSLGISQKISAIKVDVEGMEMSVLESGKLIIARDKPILYLEIAISQLERYGATVSEIEKFLGDLGYRFFRNVGQRNSNEDSFKLAELPDLAAGGEFFDLLAISSTDSRLAKAVSLSKK